MRLSTVKGGLSRVLLLLQLFRHIIEDVATSSAIALVKRSTLRRRGLAVIIAFRNFW
jgi:hypothetical protein